MQDVVIHTPRITENKTPENMPATAHNIRRYTTARYQLMYSDARCKILTWPDTLPDAKHRNQWITHCLTELRFYVTLDTKYAISDTFFPANLLASTEETKPNTTKANIHTKHKNTTTQNQRKKLKPALVAWYTTSGRETGSRLQSTVPVTHTRGWTTHRTSPTNSLTTTLPVTVKPVHNNDVKAQLN